MGSPSPLADADHGLVGTHVDVLVLHRDFLLSAGPVALEGLELGGEGSCQFVEGYRFLSNRGELGSRVERSICPDAGIPVMVTPLSGAAGSSSHAQNAATTAVIASMEIIFFMS